jgi:hypothetical protein
MSIFHRIVKGLRNPRRAFRWLFPYDYSSPGLVPLPGEFESFFPHVHKRPSFNSNVPHRGRIDARFPSVGLCTWDEATILYNYGIMLRGKSFLEVGCWVGWSTVVLGISGTQVYVIDPVLDGEPQGNACRESIHLAGLDGKIDLHGGFSPQAIDQIFPPDKKWSAFFVDGNHDGDGPTQDVMKCHERGESDCIILMHDVVMPNVRSAFDWLGAHGWNIGVHYTTQMIGVAWRGSMKPIKHQPDPSVKWKQVFAELSPELLKYQQI